MLYESEMGYDILSCSVTFLFEWRDLETTRNLRIISGHDRTWYFPNSSCVWPLSSLVKVSQRG
jgi:hypothetical protein